MPSRPPQPLYAACDLHPAFQLRYAWNAWPASMSFPPLPPGPLWEELLSEWERDGLLVLETNESPEQLQIVFSAKPDVSPQHLAGRAKGRLEHVWRKRVGTVVRFSRKVALRSLGDATRETIEAYIAGQIANEEFVDARFAHFLRQFTIIDPAVDLSQPTSTNSGRYWYNLHLVFVTVERFRIVDEVRLAIIRDGCLAIARKKGYRLSRLSVLPDHVHLALRGEIDQSPVEIALSLLNNLAYMLGGQRWWSTNYYAGTFGEYNMNAVRKP